MSTTFYLRVWTRFFDPPERVWAVKTSAECFQQEFPALASFQLDHAAALEAVQQGRTAELGGRFLGVDWPVSIDGVEPGRRFVDRSVNSLFTSWHHEHRVEPTGDGTRYIDAVTFTPAVRAAKLQAVLTERFFVRRHRAAAPLLQADARTIGVSVLRVAIDEDPR